MRLVYVQCKGGIHMETEYLYLDDCDCYDEDDNYDDDEYDVD